MTLRMTNDCVLRTATTDDRGSLVFVIRHATGSAQPFVMELK